MNKQNVSISVYGFTYGGSDFYPVSKPELMPRHPQPKDLSHHVLLAHNWYQLPSLFQTALLAVCSVPALDWLWILTPCPAGLVLRKTSGGSS